MILIGENQSTQRKAYPNATLSVISLSWTCLGITQDPRNASTHLSHDAANVESPSLNNI
jgi:hypothetical protein